MTNPANPLSPTEVQSLIAGFGDHEKFCSHLCIRNKDGAVVQYKQSPGGKKLDRAIRRQEEAGVPIRVCCLKASQVWMSSSAATQIFRRVPFFHGRRALVLADTQTHADLVFGYYTQYMKSYEDNPYGKSVGAPIFLPKLVKDTEQHIRWANDSSILVGTANNVDIGRSAPYNWVQLSEAAFYRDMGSLMTGLMQRVPNSPDSGVIVESTANGMAGEFYELCQRSMDPRRRTGWEFVFFAWHEHPEYRIPAGSMQMTREERALQQQYNLHADQIAWRRWCIDSNCSGKVERFYQEFPSNPQEAFQASGRTIFDMQAVARMPVIQEATRGHLERIQLPTGDRVQFVQREDNRGELVIYKQPIKGRNYIIGADHAEGIDPLARTTGSDPDYSSASVLDADTGEQVASLRERYEPNPWGERLYLLGWYYNWAFIVPEQKAVGKAVIGKLLDLQYPLELIYTAKRDPSDRRPPLLQELGYDTNTVFRPILISTLDGALREGAIQVHDPETISELRGFVRKPNGREEGIGHDDTVFSLALAVIGLGDARRAFEARRLRDTHQSSWKPWNYRRQEEDDD